MFPGTVTGSGPGPAVPLTTPILLCAGQVPAAASAGSHNEIRERYPSRPGGKVAVICPTAWLPSGRLNDTVNGADAPACGSVLDSDAEGENGNEAGQDPPTPS